jgi:hypothetical protein
MVCPATALVIGRQYLVSFRSYRPNRWATDRRLTFLGCDPDSDQLSWMFRSEDLHFYDSVDEEDHLDIGNLNELTCFCLSQVVGDTWTIQVYPENLTALSDALATS